MTQYPRYRFLLNPGEQLETAAPAFSIAEAVDGDLQVLPGVLETYDVLEGRRMAFLSATGLVDEEVVHTPLLTVPVPICGDLGPAPANGEYDTRRRFPHVSAEALRNPLFWLPTSLYERQVRPAPSGADNDLWAAEDPRSTDPLAPPQFELDPESGLMVETDAAWALRVAVVLTASGLYHPGEAVRDEKGNLALVDGMPVLDPADENAGTWLDVLAMVDLDPADVADAERIAAWRDGAFDPDLDSIDLEPLVTTSDPTWALDHVRSMWELVWRTGFGRLGSALTDQWSWLALLGDLVAGQGVDLADPDKARDLSVLAALTVADMADELPDDEEMSYLTEVMSKVLAGEQPDAEEAARMSAVLTASWGADLPRALAALATSETSRLLRHARAAFEDGYDLIEAELAESTLDPAEDMAYVHQVEQIARVRSGAAAEQVAALVQALPASASAGQVYGLIGDLLVGPFSDARTLVMVAATTYQPAVDFYDAQIPAA